MNTKILFLFILSTGLKCHSQTIVNLLDKKSIGSSSPHQIKEVFESTGGGTQTLFTYDIKGHLLSKMPYPKSIPSFSIFWEYSDSLPKFRSELKETNFGKMINYYSYHYDTLGYLISMKYLNHKKELISDIVIHNDSLGNPTRLETFDNQKNTIGYEIAQYLYNFNLVEIEIYNSKNEIIGVILNPINKQKQSLPLKDYLLKKSYDYLKVKAKDWPSLKVTYNHFEYKLNKKGLWIKEIYNITRYSPATDKIENSSSGYVTRNIKSYHN